MKQTIRKILGTAPLENTLYRDFSAELLDYEFDMPATFELYPARDMIADYSYFEDLEAIFKTYRRPPEMQEQKQFNSIEEKVAYRAQKAWVGEERRKNREAITLKTYRQVFGCENPVGVKYKDVFALTHAEDMVRKLPALTGWQGGFSYGVPMFVRNFDALCRSVGEGAAVAIEGGPCLFGADDMSVLIKSAAGSREFDFIDGFNYEAYGHESNALLDYVTQNAESVHEINFTNKKTRLTFDEFEHLNTQFSLAERLGCPMVVTIADMSYIKYAEELLRYTDEKLGRKARARFREEVFRIADMYLDAIRALSEKYRIKSVEVLHERNEYLMRLFYEKRRPFEDSKVIRTRQDKLASVLDYVTMPAMPYYLWGTGEIIEFNSLLESESIIKCGRIHKSAFNLYPIMFPHRVSKDGERTSYFASREYKRYAERPII
ncbi:MAG: hypothetical protein LBK57_09320 [Clostridiales Family XIII bacterium]|jgi:hypothetical protein|nr:hypothetical protein [Clostridiales Family XIII bacterium]